jgi:hypothetical protein
MRQHVGGILALRTLRTTACAHGGRCVCVCVTFMSHTQDAASSLVKKAGRMLWSQQQDQNPANVGMSRDGQTHADGEHGAARGERNEGGHARDEF